VTIKQSVGVRAVNAHDDVVFVQERIAAHRHWLGTVPWVEANGICGDYTIAAIKKFQETGAALAADRVDGVVSPRGWTIKRLEMAVIPKPTHRVFHDSVWTHPAAGQITRAHLEKAATDLGCEVAAIQAVVEVEVKIRGPWDADHGMRPTILFERHKFAGHTSDVYNLSHPDISNRNGGGYGLYRAQYPKLYRAATLNESAALKSASWGSFQILGENHVSAGFATVEAFVDAMIDNEIEHLKAFVLFVNANSRLKRALIDKNWAVFAAGYNGPGYAKNNYDVQMRNAYNRLVPPPVPKAKPKVKPKAKAR
jgi:hypothetical protein